MTVRDSASLKAFFETGDRPTQGEFGDLIDSIDLLGSAIFNVKNDTFGAKGDGSTNDTAAIQAAIDAATTNGGIVFFPSGTYMASQIEVKSKVLLDGGHFRAVELKQIASSNQDFVISESFASLTGTNKFAPTNTDVPVWFGLKDIRINGDKANQTSGNGISFYGSNMMMLGTIYVTDCNDNNIYTEGPAAATLSTVDSFEGGNFDDIISVRAGIYGWEFIGPHNSQIKSYECILDDPGDYGWYSHNIATGEATGVLDHIGFMHIYGSASGTNRKGYWFAAGAGHINYINADSVNILIDVPDPDSGAMTIDQIRLTGVGKHSTNNIGLEVNDSAVTIGKVTAETSTNVIGGGDPTLSTCVQWDGDNGYLGKFSAVDNGAGATNKALDVNGNFGQFYGLNISSFTGTGSIAVDLAGSGHKLIGRAANNKTGLNYTAGAQNNVDLEIVANAGQAAVAGSTPGTSDRFDINASGTAALRTRQRLLSDTFLIDSTGTRTVNITHNLIYTPVQRNVLVSIADADPDDWEALVKTDPSGFTSSVIKVEVVVKTASGTGSATARVVVDADVGGP